MARVRRATAIRLLLCAASLGLASELPAQDALQWAGFALVRGSSNASTPFEADPLSAQLQLGLDWSSSPSFLAHLHLLARTDDGDSEHGYAGTPEAYLELNLHSGASRVRLRGGAFFLPTSRENVDALWENPYAISSSALNSWFGEELRPVGLDVNWVRAGAVLGATVFRGNDTLGALPLDPGWSLHDRWTLLGQKVATGEDFTSVSAETDGRLGWSARGGWQAQQFSLLFTHLDNRSDALPHGDLYNWNTRFDVAGFDCNLGDWTLAAEAGWGPTKLIYPGGSFVADLRAGYLLVSRRLPRGRVTARVEAFSNGESDDYAATLAGFWTPLTRLQLGVELSAGGGQQRAVLELRGHFGGR